MNVVAHLISGLAGLAICIAIALACPRPAAMAAPGPPVVPAAHSAAQVTPDGPPWGI